jgi:hypothetical protein
LVQVAVDLTGFRAMSTLAPGVNSASARRNWFD